MRSDAARAKPLSNRAKLITRCAVSDDGRYVSFDSLATNVIAGDANTHGDVVVRDTAAATTTLLSRSTAGTQPMAIASLLGMSADGTYAMFRAAGLLQAPCSAGSNWHVFIRNRVSNITRCVSVSTAAAAQGNSHTWWGALSSNGLFTAFESDAINLPADGDGVIDAFVRDGTGATTIGVSKWHFGIVQNAALSAGPAVPITADGAYASFWTAATNTQGNEANGFVDALIVSNP